MGHIKEELKDSAGAVRCLGHALRIRPEDKVIASLLTCFFASVSSSFCRGGSFNMVMSTKMAWQSTFFSRSSFSGIKFAHGLRVGIDEGSGDSK